MSCEPVVVLLGEGQVGLRMAPSKALRSTVTEVIAGLFEVNKLEGVRDRRILR